MFEVINLNESKNLAKSLNVIIYGTIRDIEEHFIKSFTNIDLLSNFFNNVFIIIFENDSRDNTRNLLNNWVSYKNPNSPNITKVLILEENLNNIFPLRAHRLAYCRNKILNYIFDHNLDTNYQYAIHCDLDDRFWSLDYDSIFNCFQYDLNSWDGMFPINTNYSYYDFWALRCNETWYNKNIFCCEINNNENCKEFENHTSELSEFLINNKNKLISVDSAFNGIGIYKLSSLKNARYSANYECKKCYGKSSGCYEDNDHIGLHKSMVFNNHKLFINTKMILENKKNNAMSYSNFIINIKNIPNIKKNILKYVLYGKIIETTSLWLNFSEKMGIYENTLSNFNSNKIFSFCNSDNELYSDKLINDNVTKYIGNLSKNLYDFIIKNNNELISFIHIDFNNYHDTKKLFEKLYKIINNGCIIVINKFINFNGYLLNDLHAFYEFVQMYDIVFHYIGINCDFSLTNINDGDTNVAIKIINNPYLSKIEITDEFFVYYDDYITFDWVKYIENNEDLKTIQNKKDAWYHWHYFGKNEGRKIITETKNNIIENFNWKKYVENYPDLTNVKTIEEAWNHWINYGINEGRECYTNEEKNNIIDNEFDWEKYKNSNLDLTNVKTMEEAWNHWINYGISEGREYYKKQSKNVINNDFDWKKYIKTNSDLTNVKTMEEAWNHWINYGINEGRHFCVKNEMYENFDWKKYVKKNNDLNNIKNKDDAWNHWSKYGINENREFFLKNNDLIEDFDWKYYIENNTDLKDITTKETALNHWLNYGINEGRYSINKNCIKFSNFDWKYYIENNKDLNHLKTKEEAWEHWSELGKYENRLFKKKIKKSYLFL
jgi:hypothetical protein